MSSIKRERPPKHILIPDTNILWFEKKDVCVSPDFTNFWKDYAAEYDIDLILPEVVKGELLYQHTSTALLALQRINSQFDNLSGYTNKKYKHRVSTSRVRDDVRAKFEQWVASVSAEIVATPVDTINWKSLVNDALWRNPPFNEDKDKKTEKGFRDALILETVSEVANLRTTTDIAFISNDTILSEAVKLRLKQHKNFYVYDSLEEFASYLRLLDEELTNEFVQAIQKRARIKFHYYDDSKCLLKRENIIKSIREDFKDEFKPPSPRLSSRSGIPTAGRWTEKSEETVWIKAPTFVKLEGENKFIWDSRIIFVQLFEFSGRSLGTLLTGLVSDGQENLKEIQFNVTWRATVGKDARFRSMELLDIGLIDNKFEPATEEDKTLYRIQSAADE